MSGSGVTHRALVLSGCLWIESLVPRICIYASISLAALEVSGSATDHIVPLRTTEHVRQDRGVHETRERDPLRLSWIDRVKEGR